MTQPPRETLHRLHALLQAADHELVMAWSLIPRGTREWVRRRRSVIATTLVLLTALAGRPAWLPVTAVYVYVAQRTPRQMRSALVPVFTAALITPWLGALGSGFGLTTADSTTDVHWWMLSAGLIVAAGIGEAQLRAHVTRSWPDSAGLGLTVLLGISGKRWITAPPQMATLVIGPPRSGKTSGVIIPNVMAWAGPVVTTSTRRDVVEAAAAIRGRRGHVWCFEPLDSGRPLPAGVRRLDWSPIRGCDRWDTALERGRALTAGAAIAVEAADHWRARGAQLLAGLLHAAAFAHMPMSTVCEWVHANRLDPAQHVLAHHSTRGAGQLLDGLASTPDRELGSIWSAVAGSLAAFDVASVVACADRAQDSDFDPSTWLTGANSLFIVASADQATSVAPLVVGLVEEIRIAALRRTDRNGPLREPLLLALDEVANISPLPALAQIASESGGRNIVLLAATQDLSQLRTRWGAEVATGLLTLAGAKLILPGVGDSDTLDRIEKLCGKNWVVHESTTSGSLLGRNGTWSRHRGLVEEAVHPAAAIRALAPGTGLAVVGGHAPEVVDLAFHHTIEPFRSWTGGPLPGAIHD